MTCARLRWPSKKFAPLLCVLGFLIFSSLLSTELGALPAIAKHARSFFDVVASA